MERGNKHIYLRMKTLKRKNSTSSSKEDRISHLPDSLIHHILSFMHTRYAVQTCVLSTRWRYIWTSLPVLRFDHELHCPTTNDPGEWDEERSQGTKRFIKFVKKVLRLHDHSDIQKFRLEYSLNYQYTDRLYRCINKWIAAAVSHNVRELFIGANTDEDFEFPLCLCTCQSLTKLELDLCANTYDLYARCAITLPCEMSLPLLKSLHLRLDYLSFNDGKLTNKFFSSFPTLECLVIKFVVDLRSYGSEEFGFQGMNLKLFLPELKHFEFISEEYNNNILEEEVKGFSEVSLHAPSLLSFIFNSYMTTRFTLENLSSLVSADIEIKITSRQDCCNVAPTYSEICEELKALHARRFMRFLRGLHKVKVLTLRQSFIRVCL